jgi:hypothetical protein
MPVEKSEPKRRVSAVVDAPGIQESVAVLRNGLEAMQSASCVGLITTTAMAPVL